MDTRVEILKNNIWVKLVLKEDKVKYNTLSNKIGNFEQRKISHSNTFALPYVSENIVALDINVFSPVLMAEALNKKFPARYFVKDKLLQRGYLVINNTVRGEINVNFIDEALVITDEWGRTTFKQLLIQLGLDPSFYPKSVINPDFMSSIDKLKNYETDKTKKVLNVTSVTCSGEDSSIENKEVYIARYPNPLNNIGDKFNLDKEGARKIDSFNPFQSRPIFSIFGFLYLVTQAFGYRLRLDPGVDFELLRDTYLTNKGIEEGTPAKESLVTSTTPTIAKQNPQYWDYDRNGLGNRDNEGWWEHFFVYPNTTVTVDQFGRKVGVSSKRPNEFINYTPSHSYGRRREDLQIQNCIVEIEKNPFFGQVIWEGEITPRVPTNRFEFKETIVKSVWKNSVGGLFESPFTVEWETEETPKRIFKVTGEKEQLNNPPIGAISFVGLIMRVIVRHEDEYYDDQPSMVNLHFTEKVLPKGKTAYDSYGQFLENRTNLLELAPDTSIKELLSSVLQQQGLLLTFERDSNGVQNVVKLFTYGAYRDKVRQARSGTPNLFYDWSEYYQKYTYPIFNTDYGSQYGEVNEISLSNPFPGNIGRIKISTNLTNKGFQTKLVPLVQNKTKLLDDISAVTSIINTEPYFEYTNKNQGLVKCSFDQYLPGVRKQYNAELTISNIDCDPLPLLSNVIYSDEFLPIGIKEWYYLVDVAVRCDATFLLPILVIQTLDLSKPVYIESLGGFYIVEEVPEYTDNLTTVKVKLIKLPL